MKNNFNLNFNKIIIYKLFEIDKIEVLKIKKYFNYYEKSKICLYMKFIKP